MSSIENYSYDAIEMGNISVKQPEIIELGTIAVEKQKVVDLPPNLERDAAILKRFDDLEATATEQDTAVETAMRVINEAPFAKWKFGPWELDWYDDDVVHMAQFVVDFDLLAEKTAESKLGPIYDSIFNGTYTPPPASDHKEQI